MSDQVGEDEDVERLVEEIGRLRAHVAQLEQRVEQLDQLAHQDSLIDLPNRRGFMRDLERLIVFLNQLYDTLWNMYFNGGRPRLRPARFSVKGLVRRPTSHLRSNATQERIVAETRRSLEMLVRGHQAQRSHEARLRNVRLLRHR